MIAQDFMRMPTPAMFRMAEPQPVSALTQQVEMTRKLISAMMVGQMYGWTEDVEAVFALLARMLGDGRHLRISLALASAIGGDTGPANALLDEGMDDWPGAEPARVSVAMALKIGGDERWVGVCERTLATSNNDDARLFARQLLDQRYSQA
jgi:hypothetical protein